MGTLTSWCAGSALLEYGDTGRHLLGHTTPGDTTVKRSIATFAAVAGLLVFAAPALADDASSATDASAAATTSATTDTSSSEAPATTSSTTTDPASTTTSTPPSTTTSTEVPTTTTTDVPITTTTDVPVTTDIETCTVDCIPETVENDCVTADCIPTSAGGVGPVVGAGTALPFTGIGDVLAPLLLGLVVVIGGVVAWRWAQLREAVAAAASRARQMPSRSATRTGYEQARRTLDIEQRAARVFTARVA